MFRSLHGRGRAARPCAAKVFHRVKFSAVGDDRELALTERHALGAVGGTSATAQFYPFAHVTSARAKLFRRTIVAPIEAVSFSVTEVQLLHLRFASSKLNRLTASSRAVINPSIPTLPVSI